MGWKQLDSKCPQCGEPLHQDTSTGEVCCLNCDYEKQHSKHLNKIRSWLLAWRQKSNK